MQKSVTVSVFVYKNYNLKNACKENKIWNEEE